MSHRNDERDEHHSPRRHHRQEPPYTTSSSLHRPPPPPPPPLPSISTSRHNIDRYSLPMPQFHAAGYGKCSD